MNAPVPPAAPPEGESNASHFGFAQVTPEEKTRKVHEVFARVASRYDRMNDAMSLGLHRRWKDAFVADLRLRPNAECLDVAGGTGDIAVRLAKQYGAQVTLCDINTPMLAEGRARRENENRTKGFAWVCGNAEALPFTSGRFHACTIAFGIRNVTYMRAALAEMKRVLRPGGVFSCLEFSHPASALQGLYDAYSFHVIPKLGQWIAGDAASYQYLVESIRQFPTQNAFALMLEEAGFARVRYRNLAGGAVAMHTGYRL